MLGVVLIGAPQLFGGVFAWSVVVIACMAVAALGAALWATRNARPASTPWLAVAVCGAAAWTVVQALPLPCGLVSWLAPESAAALRDAVALVDPAASPWCTLSYSAGATRLEVLKGTAIVATFLAAWLLSAAGARDGVIGCCALSTLAISVVAHLHMALDVHEVFGFYRPVHASGGMQLAPLMNPNNLGGFAAFGVPIWVGILRHQREPRGRIVAALAIVLTSSTALLSLSRGAIALLFGSGALMLLSSWRSGRSLASTRGSRAMRFRIALAGALSVTVAFAAYLATDRVAAELGNFDTSKLGLIGKTLAFTTLHPWIGIGRGAFMGVYASTGAQGRFEYTENFLTQWAGDWGFPVTLALLFALGHALWHALRDARSLRRLGAIVAVVGLALQNLVDLGLELAGVVVVPAALLAAVVAPSRSTEAVPRVRWLPMRRFATYAALGCALLLAWLGPLASRDSVDELEASLRARLEDKSRDGFRTLLARAVALYPMNPIFAVLGAADSLARRDPLAPRWINRAMTLAPGWTAPHLQGFQWLWSLGRYDQAMLELRAAAEINANAVHQYACLVAPGGSDRLLRAAPLRDREQRALFLEIGASCLEVDHPVSVRLDEVLLREHPESLSARERGARRLAARGDVDAALVELDAVSRLDPKRAYPKALRVELLFAARRFPAAAEAALKLVPSVPVAEAIRMWTLRARALAELGDDKGWRSAIAGLRRTQGGDADRLADTYALSGELHQQRGQTGEALHAFREAYRIREHPGYLATFAALSLQLGDKASALWAYMRLCDVRPTGAGYCEQRDALLEAARTAKFGPGVRN